MAWEAGTDGSGLQPLGCFNGPFPGAVPQAGMVRTFGAGEEGNREWTQMDANGDGSRASAGCFMEQFPSPPAVWVWHFWGWFWLRGVCNMFGIAANREHATSVSAGRSGNECEALGRGFGFRDHPLTGRVRVLDAVLGLGKGDERLGLGKAEAPVRLFYCAKGAGWFQADGRPHPLRKGDLLVIPSGVVCVVDFRKNVPGQLHCIRAAGSDLAFYLSELGLQTVPGVVRVDEEWQVTRLLNEICQCLERPEDLASRFHAAQTLGYLLSLLLLHRGHRGCIAQDVAQKVAGAIIYMSEHLDEPLRISDLARQAGLSADYFTELFRMQTGTSPREYRQLLRMHKACQLLHGTDLKLKEIAARLGYQDPFHFSRTFKASQGESPTAYRGKARPA